MKSPTLSPMKTTMTLLILGAASNAQTTALRTVTVGPLSIEEAGFTVFWEARLPVGAAEVLENGYLRDDALYVTTDGGTVFALHAETGLLRWGEILTEPAFTIFAPSHVHTADGRGPVVIPTTNQVYVKDRYSGKDLIRFKSDFPVGTPAVGFDDVLLMGSLNGRFYSLGWDPARLVEPIKRWDVSTGGPMSAAPVLYPPKSLLIASQSGSIFSCQAHNKVLNWEYKVGGPIIGDPAVDAGGAYVPSMDRSMYKLHAQNGALLWRTRFPDPLKTGPAVAGQTVYQFTPSQGVTALDSITGAEKWQQREATQFVAHGATGDILFAPSGRLLVVDHENGKVLSIVAVPSASRAVVNTVDDTIYLLGQAGRVLCLRRDKVPYLRRQQVLMTQETMNSPPPVVRSTTTLTAPRPPAPPRDDPFRSRRDRDPATNP